MFDLDNFRKEAVRHKACNEYLIRFDACKSIEDLYNLACTIEGGYFLIRMSSEGWGMPTEELYEIFKDFINGHTERNSIVEVNGKKGEYTSTMWCGYKHPIIAKTTLNIVLDCNCDIYIPKNHICRILADGKSILHIFCPEQSSVIVETFSDRILTDNLPKVSIKKLI